jgi:hypothetical protein
MNDTDLANLCIFLGCTIVVVIMYSAYVGQRREKES